VVAKPIVGFDGNGVVFLQNGNPATERHIRVMTDDFTVPIVLQQRITGEEKRVWVAAGSPLAAVRRKPLLPDMEREPSLYPCKLTLSEEGVATEVAMTLLDRGVLLAALDLIGGHIIECNVTSPGLLVEMEAASHADLAMDTMSRIFRLAGVA